MVQTAARPPVVAAFDLDGTLAEGHSLVRFARDLAGARAVAVASLLGVATGGIPPSRRGVKEATLRRILRDRDAVTVRQAGARFAADLVGHRLIEPMVDRVRVHKAMGHELVVVSAALDVYVEPVATLLGFDAVLCTEVVAADGRCTGELRHGDLLGARKVEHLRAWLGPREADAVVYAYGNSSDDDALIEYAQGTVHRASSHP